MVCLGFAYRHVGWFHHGRRQPFYFFQPHPRCFYIQVERKALIARIELRLKQRLQSGLVEEVQRLLDSSISHHQLERYGLEYRWISYFLRGEASYQEMFQKLAVEIRRYSKRQMTFIRYLQKTGHLLIPVTDSTDFLAGVMSWLSED